MSRALSRFAEAVAIAKQPARIIRNLVCGAKRREEPAMAINKDVLDELLAGLTARMFSGRTGYSTS
jgi:hypothetical protein